MTMERKQRRLGRAQQHRNRQLRHWRLVLFSDESRFLLHRVDGRVRVRREAGQRFADDCVMGTIVHGGGSVRVLGTINYGGRTNLVILQANVNADTYQQLMATEMVPYALGVTSCSSMTTPQLIVPAGHRLSLNSRILNNWTGLLIPLT